MSTNALFTAYSSEEDLTSRCIAKADVRPGSYTLAAPPLVAVLAESQLEERCSRCFRRLREDRVRCRRCQLESYCDRSCHGSAWTEYHATLCPVLPALQYACKANKLDEHQRHTLLLLSKLVAARFGEGMSANHDRLKAVLDLDVAAIRRQSPSVADLSDQDPVSTFLALLPAELKEEDEVILDNVHEQLHTPLRELRFLLERFARNNHILSDEMLKSFAHAILPGISRVVDHSCVPSGIVSAGWDDQAGSLAVGVRTIRPLRAGEALTITYLDPILPLVERQTFLSERYHFSCDCPLCQYQGSISAPVKAGAGAATPEKLSRVFAGTVGGHLAAAGKIISATTDFGTLLREIKLPTGPLVTTVPTSLLGCLKPEVVTELTKIFEEAAGGAEWQVACVTGSHILAIYVAVYGWTYPLTGLHMLELAKTLFNAYITSSDLSANRELVRQATAYAIWAREIFQITCPTRSNGLCEGRLPMQDIETLFEALKLEWET